jgi:hypothetical protein
MKSDAGARQHFIAREQVFAMPVAAERDDVRMFEQQELIVNRALLALDDEAALQLERARVIDSTQLAQAAVTH